jgi:hypothetical protein
METSKYEPDLNKPKKPAPKPKPKPKPVKKAEFEMEEMDTYTAKKGGKVGSASKRADGVAKKGKTRGMMR